MNEMLLTVPRVTIVPARIAMITLGTSALRGHSAAAGMP
jgi:hypothetical protein